MADGRRPTTDTGTALLHIVLVVTFAVLVLTGLRIASDDPAARWLARFDLLLPMEHLWYRHLVSAVIFAATLASYATYVLRAKLTARTRLDAARLKALLRPGKSRWSALNTVVFWCLMTAMVVEVVTGAMLFFDGGHDMLRLHLQTTWVAIGCVALHVALHAASGGRRQLTRVVRPAPLIMAPPAPDLAALLADQLRQRAEAERSTPAAAEVTVADKPPAAVAAAASADGPTIKTEPLRPRSRPPVQAHPATIAIAVGCAMSSLAVGLEVTTRPVLRIAEIVPAQAPILDGDLSDPAWTKATPVSVMTSQGGDFGGSGQSLVEIRAVHDGTFAYFAFVWSDPTRSLKHMPLIKTADGWQVAVADATDPAQRHYHEDKFSVLLTRPTLPLIGAAIHLSAKPRRDRPAGGSGRGLHYTPDGTIADVWTWRASHSGHNGHIDNCHFGGAALPTAEEADGRAHYSGGFAVDPGPAAHRANIVATASASDGGSVRPWRLPRNLDAATRALGRISQSSGQSEAEGTRWWLSEGDAVAYSAAADAAIPIGAVIPGVVMHEPATAGPASIRGAARWAAGRWTLELARRLYTGSTFDVPIKSGHLLWVAAFDHADSRHSRHLRPLRLEID